MKATVLEGKKEKNICCSRHKSMYLTALFDLNFSQRKVLSCLLSDPAFQISTLEFTLGVPLPQASPSSVPKGRKDKEKTFNFQTCRLTY